MEIFKSEKTYNFMGKRIPFLGLSLFLVLASIGLIFTKGLNLGVDFSGGTIVQVQYENAAPISKIRDELSKTTKYSKVNVTKFGSDQEVILKIPTSTNSISVDIGDEIRGILKPTGNFEIRRVDMVGPKVGGELKEKGLMALSLALLVILVYVSFRFEWRFAIASILALIHDITIALGVIALFQVDVNLDILAAILTILGYSLNDTIIVFDRIREGVQTSKENDLDLVVNESVSKTLSRTTLTSLTTFFVVFTLFIFGGEIIHGFSFTLLIGVIVGTYSSIFVAATILVQLKFSISNYRQNEAEKLKQKQEKDRMRAMYEQGTV
ncbi:MAG: protein translocase subunit SecF [Campylobacteraceae bacterium]|jgi:preprotein translocase subunit SecF|nr:protein translocase subunit SecF [Campylobacteraceae bacterium]MBT3881910.1 protein translocase subunit SecF [Campylobacteraceae bacterium]MBT4030776.1 protein translocase subunit SecF [Campylobacteraceae bacterium]MBT4178733.1 protein translocase subunit SecF [Campylobacteraceae bacterium]MBT4572096.1 protein translocase subunit SecF [Campylobacteraceae bacterium]